jgi:hypothetical protein
MPRIAVFQHKFAMTMALVLMAFAVLALPAAAKIRCSYPSRDSASPFDGPLRAYLTAYGEGGDDCIAGGSARDYLDGGAGDDAIDSIDSRRGEAVECGSGHDLARIDRGDEAGSCEQTRFR